MPARRIFNPQMQNAIQVLGGSYSTREIEKMLREGLTLEAKKYLLKSLLLDQARPMSYIWETIHNFCSGEFIASHQTIASVIRGTYNPKQEWTKP